MAANSTSSLLLISLLILVTIATCAAASRSGNRGAAVEEVPSTQNASTTHLATAHSVSSSTLSKNQFSYAAYGSYSGTGTSEYWINNLDRVPPALSLLWSLAKIFGSRIIKFFGNALTLLGAITNPSNDPFASLAREATISLLNAYTSPGFPLSPGDVLSIVNNALSYDDNDQLGVMVQNLAQQFQLYNEAV
ncbi:hypothetical protein KP509_13G019300 [Ceratopteris richardii]|uniref:Uncharacterized protein n=1 Tax=Ceratopteris richardii TaxID=49495 RepID=A0A8T2TFW4_CERRI|nr:hypothetical protein KP509_13G019300 [Ceratopteris richardii]